jgi:hypothetical protein
LNFATKGFAIELDGFLAAAVEKQIRFNDMSLVVRVHKFAISLLNFIYMTNGRDPLGHPMKVSPNTLPFPPK